MGCDQSYLQLSPGPFLGRFFSGHFGPDISIHIEYCNQALEQSVAGTTHSYIFGTVLDETSGFWANGKAFRKDHVLIMPPGGDLHLYSPMDGIVLAIAIHQDALLREPCLGMAAKEWLAGLSRENVLLPAAQLAHRLREDTLQALESCRLDAFDNRESVRAVGNALIASIASKLSLQISAEPCDPANHPAASYTRFIECRERIFDHWEEITHHRGLLGNSSASIRTLQQAFSRHISLGPLAYLRLVRLHFARNALLDHRHRDQSIGDLAAQFGFWNWSRFTEQYHTHFGELPSHTRLRATERNGGRGDPYEPPRH